MRIGIFGGTFNPPHKGHIYIAQTAKTKAQLDKVIFVPCGNPPHKDLKGVVDKKHRYEMVKLSIEDFPQFETSDIEVCSAEPSYTAKTLEKMKAIYPDARLCFLVGGDSLVDMKNWYHPERIFKAAEIVVAGRGGTDEEKVKAAAEKYQSLYGACITFLDLLPVAASATDIRKGLMNRDDMSDLVAPKVLEYIKENSLY